VALSILNPQTHNYEQVGRLALVAARRSKDALALILVASHTNPMAAVATTADIDWAIQNNVYCSFVDSTRRRLLVLFDSPQEARIFTALALSAKLATSGQPTCIVNSGTGPINAADRFSVKFACYDLQQPKIEAPSCRRISSTSARPMILR
jgi:hypothetical protein